MTEKDSAGRRQVSGSEWRRVVDGVSVIQVDLEWDVRSVNGRVVGGTLLDAADARRLADAGQWSLVGVPAVYELPDDAGLPALVKAFPDLHKLEATWIRSVHVREEYEGQVVWEEDVQVFAVEHPKASRVYVWSHETDAGKRRFHTVLGWRQ